MRGGREGLERVGCEGGERGQRGECEMEQPFGNNFFWCYRDRIHKEAKSI